MGSALPSYHTQGLSEVGELRCEGILREVNMISRRPVLYKDEVLDRLSERANVAQFVSFGPDLRLRFSRLQTFSPNHRFADGKAAVVALLACATDSLVNVRSFRPEQPEGGEFIFGLQ